MIESLQLDSENDFTTVERLGNTGSVALPITLAAACQEGFLRVDDHVALLGIGSGINCIMLGLDWQESRVQGDPLDDAPTAEPVTVGR